MGDSFLEWWTANFKTTFNPLNADHLLIQAAYTFGYLAGVKANDGDEVVKR